MNRSYRAFSVLAFMGLGVLLLASAPARAQFRRPIGPPVRPILPLPPRAFVTAPPAIVPYANSFTYLPSGFNVNQATAFNALRLQTQLNNSRFYPYFSAQYLSNPYLNPALPFGATGGYFNPYVYSNPYSAPLGFYP